MSIKELEEEILEIEKIKEGLEPGSLKWNNLDAMINDKKQELGKLKTQTDDGTEAVLESCNEFNIVSCGGDCNSCGGHQ